MYIVYDILHGDRFISIFPPSILVAGSIVFSLIYMIFRIRMKHIWPIDGILYRFHYLLQLRLGTDDMKPISNTLLKQCPNGSVARYVKLWVAYAPGMLGTFSSPARVRDPDMHHGTCVTHLPWCMPGSLASSFLWSQGGGGDVPGIPGACTTRNFYVSGKRPMMNHWVYIKLQWHSQYLKISWNSCWYYSNVETHLVYRHNEILVQIHRCSEWSISWLCTLICVSHRSFDWIPVQLMGPPVQWMGP